MSSLGEIRSLVAGGHWGSLEKPLQNMSYTERKRAVVYILQSLPENVAPAFEKVSECSTHDVAFNNQAYYAQSIVAPAKHNWVRLGLWVKSSYYAPLVYLHRWHSMFHRAAMKYATELTQKVALEGLGVNDRNLYYRFTLQNVSQSSQPVIPRAWYAPSERVRFKFYTDQTHLLRAYGHYTHPSYNISNRSYSISQKDTLTQDFDLLKKQCELLTNRAQGSCPEHLRASPKQWMKLFELMFGKTWHIPMTNFFMEEVIEKFSR